jgi:5-amino-6-(5-phosphoribosylamino)uracil reductase
VDAERAASGAILVGANTIRRDDPRLLVRSAARRAERMSLGMSPSPAKVTVTASGELSRDSQFFAADEDDVARLVFCPDQAKPGRTLARGSGNQHGVQELVNDLRAGPHCSLRVF